MSNIFDARISIYRNAHDNAGEPGTLGQFLFDYSESNAAAISAIRLCHDKAERTRLKAALPAATISGYFYPIFPFGGGGEGYIATKKQFKGDNFQHEQLRHEKGIFYAWHGNEHGFMRNNPC